MNILKNVLLYHFVCIRVWWVCRPRLSDGDNQNSLYQRYHRGEISGHKEWLKIIAGEYDDKAG